MKQVKTFDIIILGGGMVGSALACALADSPLKIALLDFKAPDINWPIEGFDLRVSALTYASQQILNHLGAWKHMKQRRVSPFSEMHVWDATGQGEIHFKSEDIGAAYLGHIVENRVTLGALFDVLTTKHNIEYIEPAIASEVSFDLDSVTLVLKDNSRLNAKLIIGADGANSWLRQQAGIQIETRDYEQKGVVTTVKTVGPHQQTARQRFLPTGPLAFLPLNGDFCSIVWSTSHAEAERLLALTDEAFIEELQNAIGVTPLGEIESISKRAAFPLRKQHAEKYCKPNLVLVGDAAHTIHPLAGQGVNLGLLDIATLAEEIHDAIDRDRSFSNIQLLRRYERRRKGDNTLMLSAMDAFHMLFANDNKILSGVRNFGLSITNNLGPVKSHFIEHAMGINRRIPLVHQQQYRSHFAQSSFT